MAVMKGESDLEEDVPYFIFRYGLACTVGLSDKGAQITRCAVLCRVISFGLNSLSETCFHNDEDALILRILDFLEKLNNVTVFERFKNRTVTGSACSVRFHPHLEPAENPMTK